MRPESEEISIQGKFEEVLATGNKGLLHDFLDKQNITDVAELINENDKLEIEIADLLSVHRAASLFKILELAQQKRIIKRLHVHY